MKKLMNVTPDQLRNGDVIVGVGLVDPWITVEREVPPVEIKVGDIIDYSTGLARVAKIGDAKIVFEEGSYLWAHDEDRPNWRIYREVTE